MQLESHFQLTGGPGAVNSFVTEWIVPYHTEVGRNARWISPAQTITNGGAVPFSNLLQDVGTYTLQQTFNVPLASISFATLTGNLAADNCASIYLNNSHVATTGGTCVDFLNPSGNFTGLTAFSAITSQFLPGPNVLRVEFRNDGGPGALFVEFTNAAAEGSTVPEPGTYAAMGSGLLLLALLRRNAYR
jgi:hypothetical protein